MLKPALAAIALLLTSAVLTNAQTKEETVQQIAEHFVKVPTMAGEFIQFGPNGHQTGGKFYIQRPGKIRFNYADPTPIRIISNGKTVAVNNRKLKTWSFYPLKKTPLSLVLGEKMTIDTKTVREVRTDEDLTTLVMGDDRIFGDSIITMMFDPRTFDLRQWVIKDAQGKETTVMIFNVEKNIDIPASYFKVNQLAIQQRQNEKYER
ncbi:Outer membrane lipoprotein carrier protein LolA [hydrothermal vent metagenome]|uniref:Outer membrane lipoprotein carrier protein LolA n=1 Tax=hydrothermal vent metagenome TaxID=652676 RepID=A0A3B1B4A5_9ZZZZ